MRTTTTKMSTSIISTRSVGGRIKSSGGGNTREGGLLLLRCRSNQHRGEYDRPHPREGERCLATAAARRHGCCCYAAYKLQRSGDVVIRSMRWRWIWRIFCLRFRHLAIKPGVNAIFWSTKLLTHSTLNRFRDYPGSQGKPAHTGLGFENLCHRHLLAFTSHPLIRAS